MSKLGIKPIHLISVIFFSIFLFRGRLGSDDIEVYNFVKHFISRFTPMYPSYAMDGFTAGYGNTTSAINAVQFAMSSGNIDSGVIKLYGVS